ncbi:MAG: hypothetical protein K0U47_00825 [Epsilonproteobacteria bacterium]|nr:hypothetical protein [Campylobacterota bacterium]
MKKQYLLLIGVVLLLTACSSKPPFLSPNLVEQSIITHTKKGQIYNSLEIKASISATYLNQSIKAYEKSPDEVFLVSIFIDKDSDQKERQGIYNSTYTLTMNGQKAIKVEPLKFKDDLIKSLPTRNRWSHYYLINFEKSDQEKLNIVFKSDEYGSVVLNYQKAL